MDWPPPAVPSWRSSRQSGRVPTCLALEKNCEETRRCLACNTDANLGDLETPAARVPSGERAGCPAQPADSFRRPPASLQRRGPGQALLEGPQPTKQRVAGWKPGPPRGRAPAEAHRDVGGRVTGPSPAPSSLTDGAVGRPLPSGLHSSSCFPAAPADRFVSEYWFIGYRQTFLIMVFPHKPLKFDYRNTSIISQTESLLLICTEIYIALNLLRAFSLLQFGLCSLNITRVYLW